MLVLTAVAKLAERGVMQNLIKPNSKQLGIESINFSGIEIFGTERVESLRMIGSMLAVTDSSQHAASHHKIDGRTLLLPHPQGSCPTVVYHLLLPPTFKTCRFSWLFLLSTCFYF